MARSFNLLIANAHCKSKKKLKTMKRLILISASIFFASASFAQSRCITAPVNITGNQVTLTSSGNKSITSDQTYIYYSRRHPRRRHKDYIIAGINDKYPSAPILLSANKKVMAMPETYNVTLNTPQSTVSVCPDSTVNVAANINVEKVSAYTGNYPGSTGDNKTYKKVSKHDYKMVARKMRKIRRNEERVARKSGMAVEAASGKA